MSIKERSQKKKVEKQNRKNSIDDAKPIDDWLDRVSIEEIDSKKIEIEKQADEVEKDSQISKIDTKLQIFYTNLPPWVSRPWMYIQPTHQNQVRSWLDSWQKVIIDYSRILAIHILNLSEVINEFPFKNKKLNKQITKDHLDTIVSALVDEGLAKWLDSKHNLVRIYYKTNLEWSSIIMDYLLDTGLASEVLTLYEIENVNQEWSSLPRSELIEIFDILVNENRATWIGKDKDTISFII